MRKSCLRAQPDLGFLLVIGIISRDAAPSNVFGVIAMNDFRFSHSNAEDLNGFGIWFGEELCGAAD